jgi:hypothetical protein
MSNMKKNHKKWTVTILIIGIGFFIYYRPHKVTLIVQTTPVASIEQIKPKQANDIAPKQITHFPTPNQGTYTNTAYCKISSGTNQLIQSKSGVISVISPSINSTIRSGDAICGTAYVKQIKYRLIDNGVGVISQGSINVTDNKFSGTISFSVYIDDGRLDIYSLNNEGSEINEVQIPVKF